jgi:hypothetical protein
MELELKAKELENIGKKIRSNKGFYIITSILNIKHVLNAFLLYSNLNTLLFKPYLYIKVYFI